MKKEQAKKLPILIKTKPHFYFLQKYHKKLKENVCIIEPLTALCGGWYIETFKQVTNKLCKNKSSPLPLFFSNVQAMESISKNKTLLKKVFDAFDTRQIGRIDGCEMYCSFLLLSKGSYETFLKSIIDIFGFQSQGRISRNQFFFFLDSLYRMLPKILITQGFQHPISSELNMRLQYDDINKFLEVIFEAPRVQIERNQIYQLLMKVPQLNEFLKYLQKKCTLAAESSRVEALNKMKFEAEVRNCVSDMVLKVHLLVGNKEKGNKNVNWDNLQQQQQSDKDTPAMRQAIQNQPYQKQIKNQYSLQIGLKLRQLGQVQQMESTKRYGDPITDFFLKY